MSDQEKCWSKLPPKLLSLIANRLELRSDILSFRAVCPTWRNSAPFSLLADKTTILSPILPHKFSINVPDDHPLTPGLWRIANRPLVLVATSFFIIQSITSPNLPPWLFSVEEFNPGKLNLCSPLKRNVLNDLPKNFPNNLDLCKFRITKISTLYTLSFVDTDYDVNPKYKHRTWANFDKAVLHLDTSKSSDHTMEDCTLFVLFKDSSNGSFGKVRLRDGTFTSLNRCKIKSFDDVRIFESCGELYLVYKCPSYEDVRYKVYKLKDDEEEIKWVELKEGIGDERILFATLDGCGYIADFECFLGNTLEIAVYEFGSGECKRIDSGASQVLWPPPGWLSEDPP
ncbi:F-box protein SKIP23, partial [Bienertia sinuspersici]